MGFKGQLPVLLLFLVVGLFFFFCITFLTSNNDPLFTQLTVDYTNYLHVEPGEVIPIYDIYSKEYQKLRDQTLSEMTREELEFNEMRSKHKHCGTKVEQPENIVLDAARILSCQTTTECDIPSVRNSYSSAVRTIATYQLDVFIENDGTVSSNNAANRLSVVVAELNNAYRGAGIQFNTTLYRWGPLRHSNGNLVGTWYTESGCDSNGAQPCFEETSILRPLVNATRIAWDARGRIRVLVARIQPMAGSSYGVVGYAFFPWTTKKSILVLDPSQIVSGSFVKHHIFFGLLL